jgi:hypothetical protein
MVEDRWRTPDATFFKVRTTDCVPKGGCNSIAIRSQSENSNLPKRDREIIRTGTCRNDTGIGITMESATPLNIKLISRYGLKLPIATSESMTDARLAGTVVELEMYIQPMQNVGGGIGRRSLRQNFRRRLRHNVFESTVLQ